MIFQYTWQQVVAGAKTATRRLIREADAAVYGPAGDIVAVTHNGRVKWRVGATYAVQPGRGQPQIARIRLLSIARQRLTDCTRQDAVAEGFPDRQAFFAAWQDIHGAASLDQEVWVLAFALVERAS